MLETGPGFAKATYAWRLNPGFQTSANHQNLWYNVLYSGGLHRRGPGTDGNTVNKHGQQQGIMDGGGLLPRSRDDPEGGRRAGPGERPGLDEEVWAWGRPQRPCVPPTRWWALSGRTRGSPPRQVMSPLEGGGYDLAPGESPRLGLAPPNGAVDSGARGVS